MSDSPSSVTELEAQRPAGNHESGSTAEQRTQLLAQAPYACLCLDREWRITFANVEALRLNRLSPESLNDKTYWELFPEAMGTPFEQIARDVLRSGHPNRLEFFQQRFDLTLDVHIFPTDDGLAIYCTDISDRKRAEALRDSSVRQLQQVLAATADGIVVLDRNWTFTFANRQAVVLLDAGPLVGLNLFELFPSTRQDPFLSNYRTTMEQRIPTEFEGYCATPLNLWFRMLARPFGSGIIIFFNDITPRKKAEARRDAASRQLQQVLEATSDGVITLSRDWTFTFANRRALEMFSPLGDPIGKNFWETFPSAIYKGSPYVETYHRAMDESAPGDFEAFYPEPLNIWLSIQARPYEDGIIVFFRDITSERAYRQTLLDQRATLAFVQETARVATWEIDLSNGAMKIADGAYPVYGHPNRNIRSIHDLRRILKPGHTAQLQAAARRAITAGEVTTIDYQVLAADGSVRWVEGRGVAVRNAQGVPTHLRGMTTDITDRKQNEVELATSEQRYRVLTELNPQGIWMGSPDGHIIYANQVLLDYTGLTLEAAGTRSWRDAFSEEDRECAFQSWLTSVKTGAEYNTEARLLRARDGAVRWWWFRALPVRNDAGAILHWLGVAMDIHDSKTAADALRAEKEESERQRSELESIYESAPIGLALFDPVEFRYLRVNDRQAQTIGLPKDQILGRTISDVAPLRGLQELFETAASGHPVRNQMLEGELPSRPGEHRFWNVSYSPVHAGDGSVAAIAAVVLEMTNQKKAEAALIQSEKLAAVGRLASSISHEINNPLEAITNLLYLVGSSPELTHDTRTYVQLAQSELSRVCQIATQTLRFHRQSVNATRVTARDLVDAVLNLYQGRLSNSDIAVSTQYKAKTTLLCFENDIRQVLNNLIANAIDAMRLGGGRLIIRAHDATVTTPERPSPRHGVRITIADTGHGMPPEVQARIFEPFYTTKDLNGTGLGLWISEGIVQRHLGKLSLRSSQGPVHRGTVFTLFLPQN